MRWLMIALALALATTARAGGYESSAFGYQLELAEGWSTTAKPDASAAILTHAPSGMSVRVSGTKRGGALGAPELERLRASDEASLKKRVATYKTAPFTTPATIAGCPAAHYGFVYRDESGQVMVSRFAAFSHARGGEHVWIKISAVLPKAALAVTTPALEKLLASLRWKEAGAAPTVVESAAPPPKDSVEKFVAETAPPAAHSDEPVAGGGSSYSYKKYVKATNKQDAQRFENAFKPNATPRTAEEQARARELGLGNTFSPTK